MTIEIDRVEIEPLLDFNFATRVPQLRVVPGEYGSESDLKLEEGKITPDADTATM